MAKLKKWPGSYRNPQKVELVRTIAPLMPQEDETKDSDAERFYFTTDREWM